ncbi:hypothetical protein J6590_040080 [Homalodisca vitripennis]|nr:hypothetical protein J6590_040080 [Homalodisca vitripennis]
MIHKALTFGEPLYLCAKLAKREASQRSCRQSSQLHFPRARLEVAATESRRTALNSYRRWGGIGQTGLAMLVMAPTQLLCAESVITVISLSC